MTGRPATRTRGLGTRLVSGSSRVPFPASGTMICTYPFPQRPLDQGLPLLDAQHDLPGQHVDRLVLPVVILQRQDVPGLDVQDLPDIAAGLCPDELVAPGLVDAVGEVGQGPSQCGMRSAECGM